MELIPINETKLKIMLDEIDMKQYRLGAESDCANLETRRAIRNILDVARDRIGFNTEGAEIFVQLYASKKGGCELFVTKGETCDALGQECNYTSESISAHLPKKDDRAYSSAQKSKKKEPQKTAPRAELAPRKSSLPQQRKNDVGKIAFCFNSIRDLCIVCAILLERGIMAGSRAFKDEIGVFYLLLSGTGMSAYSRLDKLSFIYEYGVRESFDEIATYLCEHGTVICEEGAIELLGTM
jgi:negative regulator of genetic competence, sporulation and motility